MTRQETRQAGRYVLTRPTLLAALAVGVAQVALAIPAAPNGLFQQDLAPTSSQLTWISGAFVVPVWYPGARKRPGTLP